MLKTGTRPIRSIEGTITGRGDEPPLAIVLGVVIRDGRILVQPRTGDPGLGDGWELPGGKREAGEADAEALVREVEEETGLEVRVEDLLCAFTHTYPDRRVSLYVYRCRPVGPAAAARPAARWVSLEECRDLPMPVANRAILEAVDWESTRGVDRQ